jgi:hypothetical protein
MPEFNGEPIPVVATSPLDQIIEMLTEMRGALVKAGLLPATPGEPAPVKTGGIYEFKRPVPVEPRHGLGKKMGSADEKEFIERSRYAVRYSGQLSLSPGQEDEAWAEITAIQTGDTGIVKAYAEAGVDPMLVAVLLMQGELKPVKYDGPTFGDAAQKRAALAGKSPQSWLKDEFEVMAGNPAPSGGDEPNPSGGKYGKKSYK